MCITGIQISTLSFGFSLNLSFPRTSVLVHTRLRVKSNGVSTRRRGNTITTSSLTHGLARSADMEDESLLDEDPYYYTTAALDELEKEEEEDDDDDEEEEEEDSSVLNTGGSEDDCICGAEDDLLSDLEEDISSEATGSMGADELSFHTETSGIGLEDSFTQLSLSHNGSSTELDQTNDQLSDRFTADMHFHHYRLSLARSDTAVATSDPLGRVCATVPVGATNMERGAGEGDVRGTDQASPALTPSLFPNLPPTIHFPLHNEKCE